MADEDVVRLLVDLVRDQSKVLSAIAEGVAVGTDRSARIAEMGEKMSEMLSRLDAYITREEQANALARAQVEISRAGEQALLSRIYDAVKSGVQSSTGQRAIQTVVIAALAWAGVHFGVVAPPTVEPPPHQIGAPPSDAYSTP